MATPQQASSRRARFIQICVCMILAAAARIATMGVMPDGLNRDTDAYRRIAVTLRQTGTFGVHTVEQPAGVKPTAFRPPLYPMLLAPLVGDGTIRPPSIGLLHAALGMVTTALVVWLGHLWKLGRSTWVAGILTACDPLLLNQSVQIMTETLAAFLAAATLVCVTLAVDNGEEPTGENSTGRSKRSWLAFLTVGVLLGLAGLCRPTFLPWAALVIAVSYFRSVRPDRWRPTVSIAAGVALAVLPWGIRNLAQFGHFKLSTTHGGYTLLLGNNPDFYEYLRIARWGEVWGSEKLDRQWTAARSHRDEFADDRVAYEMAQTAIRAEPRMFAYACIVRVARFWHFLPRQTVTNEATVKKVLRLGTATWYLIVYGLLLVAVFRCFDQLARTPWLWGILLCFAYTAVHSIYWSDMRMRAPLMPFLSLVAALGVEELKTIWRGRRASGKQPPKRRK